MRTARVQASGEKFGDPAENSILGAEAVAKS